MPSQISEISPVFVQVSVEVPWPDVEKAIEGSYAQLGRTARVKGFRPGKVPRNVLRQLFGKRVKQEVVSNLVESGLGRAVGEHKLAVVAAPSLEQQPEIKQGEPLAFSAKIEVRPNIESVDIAGIALTRNAATVSDEHVTQALERLRQQHAEVRPVEPARPAQEADIVTCDYAVKVDGTERPDLGATDRPIELGGSLLAELKAALLGKQAGDEVQAELVFPAEQGGEFAGKPAVFDVKIKEIKEKVLPALDDEFAKDVDHESLEDLKQKTREKLEASAREQAESALRDQLIEKVIEKNPIEIPPSLAQQQHQAMLQEYLRMMQMTGQRLDMNENVFEDMKRDAERRVRAALLLGAVARLNSIRVPPEELDKRFEEIAQKTGKHIAKVRAEMQGEQREMLESQLLEEKLLEYLLGQATITEEAT